MTAEGHHTYRGWMINVFRQKNWPPYLDYTAFASRRTGGKVITFNVDADTPERCLRLAQKQIDEREGL